MRLTAVRMHRSSVSATLLLLSLMLIASAGGCLFGGREKADIKSPDPALKIPAIKTAVQRKDMSVITALVKDLESDDPAVRFYAIHGLQELTGETFGYAYYTDGDERQSALRQWQDWLSRSETSVADGGEPVPMRARTQGPSSPQP